MEKYLANQHKELDGQEVTREDLKEELWELEELFEVLGHKINPTAKVNLCIHMETIKRKLNNCETKIK